MGNKSEIQGHIKNLRDTIITANLNYEIWWIYMSKDTRSKYINIMNNYRSFFSTSTHAHFVTMIIVLYRLYETCKNTINIPQLIKLMEQNGYLSDELKKEINTFYPKAKQIWIKVGIIRSEVFAHANKDSNTDKSVRKANIKYRNFKELIELSITILNLLTQNFDKSFHAFTLSAEEDTKNLLDTLLKTL